MAGTIRKTTSNGLPSYRVRIRQSTATHPSGLASTGFRSSSAICWMRNHQVSDGHDSFRNETQVYRRTAPQPAEDRGAPQGRQHGPGLPGIHRGDGQLHIPLRLDQDATQPGHHHRPELRIPHPAHQQLDPPVLMLHQH